MFICLEEYYGGHAYIKVELLLEGWKWAFNLGFGDKWIPNYLTNSIIHSAKEEVQDALVSDIINQELHL